MSLRKLAAVLAFVAIGLALAFVVFVIPNGPVIPRQDAAVAGIPADAVSIELREAAGGYIEIVSSLPGVEPDTLFVLYPGGRVRPQAYAWIGVALAPLGVRTVIPVMPLDLAVLAANRAAELMQAHPDASTVVIGGHSLGGAMAARFVANAEDRIDGLVLMAAFSAESDDLSGRELPTLVLAAEHDGLATLEEVRAGMQRLPTDADLVVLDGAVHAFLGRYGPQSGDGIPTTTRGETEAEMLARLAAFMQQVRSSGLR